MRYLTYRRGGQTCLGSLQEGYIVDVQAVAGFGDLLELIQAGPETWQAVAEKLRSVKLDELSDAKTAFEEKAELIATPLSHPPKNVICLGRNYYKHYLEGAVSRGEADKPPEAPIYFTKPHTAIIGPYDPVPYDPAVSDKLDWEAELGLIIGVGGRKIEAADAFKHVFGYTVINDISARDLQYKHQQWFRGKGLDGSCPIGPVVVTPDELPASVHLAISLKINGELKQEANTNQLMFDIPAIIVDISSSMTLEPGDIISTGTPDGVGHFRKPPEYLQPGDLMETEIEKIGVLRNPVVSVSV